MTQETNNPIRTLTETFGLTHTQIAVKLGVTYRSITRYRKNPTALSKPVQLALQAIIAELEGQKR